MENKILNIIIPSRLQLDTLVSIFLLKKFGEEMYSGIVEAYVEIKPMIDENFDNSNSILLGVGGGDFDNHVSDKKTTISKLVAEKIGVLNDPALKKVLMLVDRDDKDGKGIVSEDYLDKAFGISGLLMSLNRTYIDNPTEVVSVLLPILGAHYFEEYKRTVELPLRIVQKINNGEMISFVIKNNNSKTKVAIIKDEDPSMNVHLRSQKGGFYDIVAQKLSSGHLNILTRRATRVNLSRLAAVVRSTEAMLKNKVIPEDMAKLSKEGRLEEVSEWYFDPVTNSLLNGGMSPSEVEPSVIPFDKLKDILLIGLQN